LKSSDTVAAGIVM